jgi:hypothetical protein
VTWHEWSLDVSDGWSHHNVAVLDDGSIVGYHPKARALVHFDADGSLRRTVPCEATEAHDLVVGGDGRSLWLADCGNKLSLDADGKPFVDPPVEQAVGAVLHVDFDGRTIRRIGAWHDGPFSPTGIALERRGVWIADGYGSNRVDLVDEDDAVLVTIDGLDCPHGVRIDERGDEPLLVLAERGKARLAVHDLDGGFVRHLGVGDLRAPCAIAFRDDRTYVADLTGRVTVLDRDGRLVAHLGDDPDVLARKGWPNAVDRGRAVPPPREHGSFNSPHGIAVAGDDLIVTEWLLGGRWVRCSTDELLRR